MHRRNKLILLLLAALLPLALVAGVWLGGHSSWMPAGVRSVFVGDEEARSISQVLDTIQRDYYRKIDRDELVDDSISGAIRGLDDRFSAYFNPQQYRSFRDATDARFSGIGVSVAEVKDGLRIHRVFTDSPAAKAGIRVGDVVVAVNRRSIAGEPSSVASARIKGEPGTKVELTVARGDRRRELSLERARISVPAVESRLRTVDGVKLADISLSGFTSGAHGELRQAVDRALDRGAKGIVLDLRANGGGLLDEAVLVSSIFVPEGTVVSTNGRSRGRRVFKATGDAIDAKVPVVVLVDRGTASASEIVTGALKDRKRAKVVGVRTFGKGVFQQIEELPNGGAIELTVGQYFTPSGRNLGGGGTNPGAGIRPDVPAADRPSTRRDEGLDVALGELADEVRGRSDARSR